MTVVTGVPQGSVLGPILWNILYDGVLNVSLLEGCRTIAFADDLALLVDAENENYLEFKVNECLRRIDNWMKKNKLEISPTKSETVLLKHPRKFSNVTFKIQNQTITTKNCIKYLGILIDNRLKFSEHIKYSTRKAEVCASKITKLLPNIGGPSSTKRLVLRVLLYGSPIWSNALNIKFYRNMMESVQRKIMIRVASAYKTVSLRAIEVISGIIPFKLLVEERQVIYENDMKNKDLQKKTERERTLNKWQTLWNETTTTAQWTKLLIPEIKQWILCKHRRTDYYLTQFLSGHGSFRNYTHRFQLSENDKCIYCDLIDSPKHTIFECARWTELRHEFYKTINYDICPNNIISHMISNIKKWEEIHNYIRNIMSLKENEEREYKRQLI